MHFFHQKTGCVWPDDYKSDCSEDGSLNSFYAKHKSILDLMDNNGYYPNDHTMGPFLLMLGKNGVTLVLPGSIGNSPFFNKILDIVAGKLNVPAQKNY